MPDRLIRDAMIIIIREAKNRPAPGGAGWGKQDHGLHIMTGEKYFLRTLPSSSLDGI